MSQLSFIKQLLDGVDVEWKSLSEVGELVRGNGLPKTDFTDSGVPAIHYGQIYTHYGLSTTSTLSFVSEETAKKLKRVDNGDVIITNTSENFEDVGKSLVYLGKEQAVTGGHATIFKPSDEILGKYFAYFTQTKAFVDQKRKYAKGIKVIDVSANDFSKIFVPIPCSKDPRRSLEIQTEIVRILDIFSVQTQELTHELTQELFARKKQYNHYRDALLSFDEENVELKPLGELAKIQRGASPRPIARYITNDEKGIPWIKIGDTTPNSKFVTNTAQRITQEGSKKSRLLKKNDFIMSNSMSYGRPYILAIDGAIHDGWASISEFGKYLNSDFLYHYLSSNKVKNYWESKINSSSVSNLNSGIIRSLPIPIISLEQQIIIAKVLDKFDTLSSDVIKALPEEIELRQKQYEYYRDLLLSFSKPDEVEV